VGDLKPIDLFLASLKPGESWVEERTVADLQIARKSWEKGSVVEDNQKVVLEAAILERVRNRSLVKLAGPEKGRD